MTYTYKLNINYTGKPGEKISDLEPWIIEGISCDFINHDNSIVNDIRKLIDTGLVTMHNIGFVTNIDLLNNTLCASIMYRNENLDYGEIAHPSINEAYVDITFTSLTRDGVPNIVLSPIFLKDTNYEGEDVIVYNGENIRRRIST